MSNTPHVERRRLMALGSAAAIGMALSSGCATPQKPNGNQDMAIPPTSEQLTRAQQAIVPIAALAAAGDMPRLNAALHQGLDAGLSISDAREVLVQLYAYAGFPRSLNALAALMQVVDARKQRGVQDAPGRAPSRPIPQGAALLAAGTANQTRLIGAPVQGPLFDFAPVANEYLRNHLFGDIFERDNLDWHSREVATVSMLAAMTGVESQLLSHIRASMNIGVTANQLRQIGQLLADRVSAESGQRTRAALQQHLASKPAG
jgi:4-carboxymuconolactone decarboxylase